MTDVTLARIIAIDYGEKRIGIAMSDPLGITAYPWGMVPMTAAGIGELAALVDSEKVTTVVVGMPLTLKGEVGPKAKEVQAFIDRIKRNITGVEIIEWDERFTTAMANRTLRTLETKRGGRSQKTGRVDAMAAAVLLQSFLDSTKHSRVC